MPRFDGTGPQGKGPKTGREMGNCSDAEQKSSNFGWGRGLGRGFGRGYGASTQQEKSDKNS